MIGDEWTRRRAAVNGLQDGRFNLQETLVIQELAQRGDHLGAHAEDLAYFLVHRQVSVALTIARFRVSQGGVPHHLPIHHLVLGSWQGDDCLGQHLEVLHLQADLTGARAHKVTFRLDVIAQVKVVLEALHGFLTQLVDAQEELDAPAAVLDVRKGQLAHRAYGAQAAAQDGRKPLGVAGGFRCLKALDGLGAGLVHLGTGGVGFHPCCTHFFDLFQANLFEF